MDANSSNVKTIILCGGMGTRMREETEFKPKPLVDIGGKPMMDHVVEKILELRDDRIGFK